jgi:protein arginine kinase activator
MHSYPCDKCGDEATIHEYCGSGGAVDTEVHLCESCAQAMGVETKGGGDLSSLLKKIVVAGETEESNKPTVCCPTCGMRWAQFRRRSRLGCADCFTAFEDKLAVILSRIHEGATQHVGKSVQNVEGPGAELQELRRDLRSALDEEHYERAAQIRDQIAKIEPARVNEPHAGPEDD